MEHVAEYDKSVPRPVWLEHLVAVHYGQVLRLLTRLTGSVSVAEDLTQTTFASLIRSGRPLGSEEEERAYVIRAAYNAWRRWGKRKAPGPVDPEMLDQIESDGVRDSDSLSLREDLARVRTALAALPDNQRAAVILIVLEGMTYNDVAEMMGVSRDTVSKWRTRGLQRLREVLIGDSRSLAEAG